MTSNLELLQELKKEYNAKTAFGNPVLIKIINNFRLPNKEGLFEADGIAERIRIDRISWRCVDCGAYNTEESDYDEFEEGKKIDRKCCVCGKEHIIEIFED